MEYVDTWMKYVPMDGFLPKATASVIVDHRKNDRVPSEKASDLPTGAAQGAGLV